MAVMPRETWTDERLDDLTERMDSGFREQREETRALRVEMQAMRAEMHEEIKALRVEMQAGFARIDARIDSMQRLMIAALLTIVLGFIVDKI